MNKRFIPFAHSKTIFELDDSFFKALKIKTVLTDLDNTLDNNKVSKPSKKVIEFKNRLDSLGINLIILSNNLPKRVSKYANELGVEYKCQMCKPFSYKINKFVKTKGLNRDEVLFIGDQIITDIWAGNGAKIKTILTEPLSEPEPPWTKFNRFFEKPIKKKLFKDGIIKNWKDVI